MRKWSQRIRNIQLRLLEVVGVWVKSGLPEDEVDSVSSVWTSWCYGPSDGSFRWLCWFGLVIGCETERVVCGLCGVVLLPHIISCIWTVVLFPLCFLIHHCLLTAGLQFCTLLLSRPERGSGWFRPGRAGPGQGSHCVDAKLRCNKWLKKRDFCKRTFLHLSFHYWSEFLSSRQLMVSFVSRNLHKHEAF